MPHTASGTCTFPWLANQFSFYCCFLINLLQHTYVALQLPYLLLHHLIVAFSRDNTCIACSMMPQVLPTGSHDFPFPESGIAGLA